MNESVMHRETEDGIIALFYYLLLLNFLHYYFSLYICSIGRYCTENMLSFTLNIMLTNSLLLTNTTNRMLTILIANLLTLGIIRTVDIFTCPLKRMLGGAKHEIGAMMLKQRNEKTFGEDISVEETCWTRKSSVIARSLTK
jgi:hypothetical protein